MSSATATDPLDLDQDWYRDRPAVWALVLSLVLHLAAVVFLPSLSKPRPAEKVLTVELAKPEEVKPPPKPEPKPKPLPRKERTAPAPKAPKPASG